MVQSPSWEANWFATSQEIPRISRIPKVSNPAGRICSSLVSIVRCASNGLCEEMITRWEDSYRLCLWYWNFKMRPSRPDLGWYATKRKNGVIYKDTHVMGQSYISSSSSLYTGFPRRNVPDFGRVFLMLKYTDITQNTYPKLNGYGDNGQRSLKLWQLLHTYWLPNTY